mgnify:CR=1 FL=1
MKTIIFLLSFFNPNFKDEMTFVEMDSLKFKTLYNNCIVESKEYGIPYDCSKECSEFARKNSEYNQTYIVTMRKLDHKIIKKEKKIKELYLNLK